MYFIFLLLITLITAPQACQAMNAELKVMRAASSLSKPAASGKQATSSRTPEGTGKQAAHGDNWQAECKRPKLLERKECVQSTEPAEAEENSDDDITPEMLIPDYAKQSRLTELYHDEFGNMPLWQAKVELLLFGKTCPTNQEPKEHLRLLQRLELAGYCRPEFQSFLVTLKEIASADHVRSTLKPKYHTTIERYLKTLIYNGIDQLKDHFNVIKNKYPRSEFMAHAQDCVHKKVAEEFIPYTALTEKARAWINTMVEIRLNELNSPLWLEAVKKYLDADIIDNAVLQAALTINPQELAEMSHAAAKKAILNSMSAAEEYPEYALREKLYSMAEQFTIELLHSTNEAFRTEVRLCTTGVQYITFIATHVHLALQEELFIYPLLSEETITILDTIIREVITRETKIDASTIFTQQDVSYEENYDDDQGAEDGFQIAQACIRKGAPV